MAGSDEQTLHLRPVSGSETEQVLIYAPLELEPVTAATFGWPRADESGDHTNARLLRDALVLCTRAGAGPFRSLGQLAVEPRAYQLVPLLMALRMPTIRLLVADDVGIGKTIEAALIARELLDRGDIERTTVLCPPHLVDQWVRELEEHFNLHAVAVTAASASRLERRLPQGESIFGAHPHTVVSLDYIKSERRRAEFLRACPGFVIVDEAHTCTSHGRGRHQRYELLQGLSQDPQRHLVLLTATPHSGDDRAFHALLGLLDARFEALADADADQRKTLRRELSRHFVQRRRPDIAEWQQGRIFPRRETTELTYALVGEGEEFFAQVLRHCAEVVEAKPGAEPTPSTTYWSSLALMRCAGSSPAAALAALRNRADAETPAEELAERIADGVEGLGGQDDREPAVAVDGVLLTVLLAQAERLVASGADPKLACLREHLGRLLADGFDPVVFCRYIATAHYLSERLKFEGVAVDAVTGELGAAERKRRVEALGDAPRRILVATDCLSEGINLQEHFDAVVHYDLSWNPTRHEQREGRVDRFGQGSPVVRTTLLYGVNNPVDGAVLEVIVRKAAKIRAELGVPVPLPAEGEALTRALMQAVFVDPRRAERQLELDFSASEEAERLEDEWTNAAQRARRSRTVFAQRRLQPEEVLPQWTRALASIGSREDVRRFVEHALEHLGGALRSLEPGFEIRLDDLPRVVREGLAAEGLEGTLRVDFDYPASPRCRSIHRSHPLVRVLAETLLDRTLAPRPPGESTAGSLGRVGQWSSEAVTVPTTVALLRLRHRLTTRRAQQRRSAIVEEAVAVAWSTDDGAPRSSGDEAMALLTDAPWMEPEAPSPAEIEAALGQLREHRERLDEHARERAQLLLEEHRRARKASRASGSHAVEPLLPVDVIGLYLLTPGGR
ncbi:MAG: helicase-related protein [Myxococcota bacterium]